MLFVMRLEKTTLYKSTVVEFKYKNYSWKYIAYWKEKYILWTSESCPDIMDDEVIDEIEHIYNLKNKS